MLLGVHRDDAESDAIYMAEKLAGLRIFQDDEGKMNRSVMDIAGGVLVVSQFTLLGDVRKGKRPSFVDAAPPEVAIPLYEQVCDRLAAAGLQVERGVFGAYMQVHLVNDGPVTIQIDSRKLY